MTSNAGAAAVSFFPGPNPKVSIGAQGLTFNLVGFVGLHLGEVLPST